MLKNQRLLAPQQFAIIEVFTSLTCPHCPHAKKVALKVSKDRDDVKIVETSIATKQGQKRSRSFQIRSVPTLIITGPGSDENIGYVGTPSENQLNKMINIALGKEEWKQENNESFFQKVAKKLKIKMKGDET